MSGKHHEYILIITTGRMYISPVLSFDIDVHFSFIIQLPVIYNYLYFYSTHVPDIIHRIQHNFEKGKLEWYEIKEFEEAYPEIGDANFEGTLWTFKQTLSLKMWARCGISIVLLQTSVYCAFRETWVTTGWLTCYHFHDNLL